MSKSRFSAMLVAVAWLLTAPPAAAQLTTGGCFLSEGSGSPEGAVRGSICDHYTNTTDGTAWLKLTGSNTTTGWVQLPSTFPVSAAQGGTGLNTAAWSGIPSVNAGVWQPNNVLTSGRVLFAGASNSVSSSANLTFDGTALTVAGFGVSQFAASGTGGMGVRIHNTADSATNFATLDLGNDLSATRTRIRVQASNFTTSGILTADGLTITHAGAGGISIAPTGGAGGDTRFYRNTGQLAGTMHDTGLFEWLGLVSVTGFGAHSISAAGTGQNNLTLRNESAGVGNLAAFLIGNDASSAAGQVIHTSTTFTTSGSLVQDGFLIAGARPGGVSLNAANATGDVRIYSRNVLAVTFGASQAATFTGLANANAGIAVDTTAFTVADATGHVDTLGYVGSRGFVSQTTGWRCTFLGACDARYIFADELRIKLFSVEEQAVYRASLMVTKSHSEVALAFTCPAAGGGATLTVRDAATLADARVFAVGDWVVIRAFVRTDSDADGNQELVVGDCVGSVSSYADNSGANEGTQNWTFTRGSGASAGAMSASTVVPVGSAVLDFGVSGNGAVELNAYDGAEGINAPWIQTKRWTTAPVAANFAVTSRLGKLTGITGTADEFGLIAGIYAATDGQYFRASNAAFDLHGITARWWDGATNVITIAPNSGAPYIGIGNPAPSTCCTTPGIFMGWTAGNVAAFSAFADANNFLTYDGTKLTWKAANTTLDASGNLTATSATLSGSITATTGAIGGFNIGADYIRDVANTFGLSSTVTGGDDIRFFAGAAHPGTGAEFYVTESGTLFAVQGTIGGWTLASTSLTSGSGATTVGLDSGGTNPAIYAGSATPGSAPFRVTNAGAMTATSGAIGGFTIGATTLSATNLSATSGAANTAHILVGTGSTAGGLNSANASGDIAIWAGATHANRATAPFRVTAGGALTATNITLTADQVTIDSTGITIAPRTVDGFLNANAYRWSVSNGNLGISGSDTSSVRHMRLLSDSAVSGKSASVSIDANYNVGGSNPFATLSMTANSAGASVTIGTGLTGTRTISLSAGTITTTGAVVVNDGLTITGQAVFSAVPRFNGATQTTVGAAGGAAALPSNPTGYLVVNIAGTEYVIPAYTK